MLNLTPEQVKRYNQLRQEWMEMLKPDINGVFAKVPDLELRHVLNCRMLPDRYTLLELLPKHAVCAEVGTQEGLFAAHIKEVCKPCELHIFDIDMSLFKARGVVPAENGVFVHEGDSSTMLATFKDGYFDWIYIDGDHSYEGVFRDAEVARRKIKQDGILVFNDYTYWSPIEMIPYGVVAVVNELCLNHNFEIIYFALHYWMYCDVAIRRRLIGLCPLSDQPAE